MLTDLVQFIIAEFKPPFTHTHTNDRNRLLPTEKASAQKRFSEWILFCYVYMFFISSLHCQELENRQYSRQ
jgi:hypothetical protein